ncbi:hypothetical protein EYZ11_000334 [Aspergillus tanneri]|nr:hypothetical protein EYZ11_000334 [Aspergillus tanneri]
MPCRMALLSRQKLDKETSTKSPDLRRCLGHNRILRRSMEIAHEDMKKAMMTMRVDDGPLDAKMETPPMSILRDQIASALKAVVRRRMPSDHDAKAVELTRVESNGPQSGEAPSVKTASVSSRSRRYAAKFTFGRKWEPSPVQLVT